MRSKKTIARYQPITINHCFSVETPELLQRIYLNRGITSLSQVETDLKDLLPFTDLLNIDQACILLGKALEIQQKILVIGDFDADGATSTALAVKALKAFGAKYVDYLLPNRFTNGYGLTPEIVALALRQYAPDLIITVDNGISSHAGVLAAREQGIKVLITDHHLAPENLPLADVIINPNQPGDHFPSKALAGVGVIFYVMIALRRFLREKEWFIQQKILEPTMTQWIDLVALGTVADVVPLDRNNRILVQQGLQRIRRGYMCSGIKALLQISKRSSENLLASDLGFAIGPRLNAAGRLEDMSLGVACLLCEHLPDALQMASQLDRLNQERRSIENDMIDQAEAYLQQLSLAAPTGVLCLYQPEWHQGVIGILAGRLKDRYHIPTLIFAKSENNTLKGSGRSIPQLHLRDALALVDMQHPGLISKFGGHAMASGLTIHEDRYADFCAAFASAVDEILEGKHPENLVMTDGALSETELNLQTAELLLARGPWGQGFPEPLFDGYFRVVHQRLINEKHIKLTLQMLNTSSITLEAIAFNMANIEPLGECIHIAYKLDINRYNQQRKLQLLIEYMTNLEA